MLLHNVGLLTTYNQKYISTPIIFLFKLITQNFFPHPIVFFIILQEPQQNYEITAFDTGKNRKNNDICLKSKMLMCTKIFLVKGSQEYYAPTLGQ